MLNPRRTSFVRGGRWVHCALILGATLLYSGCGVETITFIEGPNDDEITVTEDPATIVFAHNNSTANQTDDFLGYELYYKFYNFSSVDPYVSDQNSILSDPVATGTSRLTSRGYLRVIRNNSSASIPAIAITDNNDKDEQFDITLDFFESTGDVDAEATWTIGAGPTQNVTLRRNTEDTGPTDFKSFFGQPTDFDNGDDDVDTALETAAQSGELGLAIYALGYGVEGGTFQQLYSEPVFLGYVRLVLQP